VYILPYEKTLLELEEEKNINDQPFWGDNYLYYYKKSPTPPRILYFLIGCFMNR
jgi:hypothetical protein